MHIGNHIHARGLVERSIFQHLPCTRTTCHICLFNPLIHCISIFLVCKRPDNILIALFLYKKITIQLFFYGNFSLPNKCSIPWTKIARDGMHHCLFFVGNGYHAKLVMVHPNANSCALTKPHYIYNSAFKTASTLTGHHIAYQVDL